MFHEVTKYCIPINRVEDTFLSWHNSVIALRTMKGLHLFDFSYNLESFDKKLDFYESIIQVPNYSPVSDLFQNSFVGKGMRNSEFIQLTLDPTLWPHNSQLMDKSVAITSFKWSPIGFITNMNCAIAVMTNVGSVELFACEGHNWNSILNLSAVLRDNLNVSPFSETLEKFPKNLVELKEIAHLLATTAICWSDKTNSDNTCYFATAQKNGYILFWSLLWQNDMVYTELIGNFKTDMLEMFDMCWIPTNTNNFLLIVSNIVGQVNAYNFEVENKCIKYKKCIELWPQRDRMVAKHCNYLYDGDRLVLIYSKHRHLVMQVLDNSHNVISKYVSNINDYRISTITKNKNNFYLGTINGKIYKVNFLHETNADLVLIEIREKYPTSELYDLHFSTNGVLLAMILIDRRVLWRKEPLKVNLIFFISSENYQDLEIFALINNPTKQLTYHWDYIEVLRYKVMKSKVLPPIDYNKLWNEANSDIYKLKIYFILLILYNNLESLCKNGSKGILPKTSLEEIRETILANHARNLVNSLYGKYKNSITFNELESEMLNGTMAYLNYYCHKYEKELKDLINIEIMKIVDTDTKNSCQCCDNQIEYFSCASGHINAFCSLTFTRIENDDYLTCKCCGVLARIELFFDKPKCVFCDLYLQQ